MTITTLEPTTIEGVNLSAEIPCENPDCPAVATWRVHTFCCPRLACEPCKDSLIEYTAALLPVVATCMNCPDSIKTCLRVSDFIVFSTQALKSMVN